MKKMLESLCFQPTHQTKSKHKIHEPKQTQKKTTEGRNQKFADLQHMSQTILKIIESKVNWFFNYKEKRFKLQNFFAPIMASNRCSLSLAGNFCLPQMKNNETRSRQGPLIADGRNCNEMLILRTSLLQATLGISKVMNISLPNLYDLNFGS